MVKLVRNKENAIPVNVTALIPYAGFSATLDIEGIYRKDIHNLKTANPKFEFSTSDVDKIGEDGITGTLTVINNSGKIHTISRVTFAAVDDEREAAGFQAIYLPIVSLLKYMGSRRDGGGGGGGGGGGDEYVSHQEFDNTVDGINQEIRVVDDHASEFYYEDDEALEFH